MIPSPRYEQQETVPIPLPPPTPESTTMTLLKDIMKKFSFLFPPPREGNGKR